MTAVTRTVLLYLFVWSYAVVLGWMLCECVRGSCPVPRNAAGELPPRE